jgi:hypothetical protein
MADIGASLCKSSPPGNAPHRIRQPMPARRKPMSAAQLRNAQANLVNIRRARGRIASRRSASGPGSRNPAQSFGVVPEQSGNGSGRELRDEKPE